MPPSDEPILCGWCDRPVVLLETGVWTHVLTGLRACTGSEITYAQPADLRILPKSTRDRPSRDRVLVDMALCQAQRATCSRLSVGALFSRSGRVLITGYNGPASGAPECAHGDDAACDVSIHAEANAIAWAAREGVRLAESELHVTHSPCLYCARLIVQAGAVRVTYLHPYRKTEAVAFLTDMGVDVAQLSYRELSYRG